MIVSNSLVQEATETAHSLFSVAYQKPHDLTPEHVGYYAVFNQVAGIVLLHMIAEVSYGSVPPNDLSGTVLYGVTVAYPGGAPSCTKNCAFTTLADARKYIETLGEVVVVV